MQSTDKEQLFTEITAEEATNINGGSIVGFFVMRLVFIAGRWIWMQVRK
jgi:hypothetical protein